MATAPAIDEAALVGIVWAGTALSVILVIFRTMVRWKKVGKLYEDDMLVYLAMTILLTMVILYHIAIPPM